ncbi:aminodeoxychorismate lyase [Catenovulum sp. SM1970]|uniref:aminodeoxychorismate lyase n=1 Tax=Marinifaba aquimaris TaxID=2741323 RepID=UPI001573E876|nr:aminodeoxychorismate lyase [Marinifaba aquimaris]NTS77962.1 aminodeoxychorismate lyase [Marinifaba aquimaris]
MAIDLTLTICEQEHEQVSAYDRGLQFGDAHFTTMLVVNGQIHLLENHIERLKLASETLSFPQLNWPLLKEQLIRLALNKTNEGTAVFKLILSRGTSQRGYASAKPSLPRGYLFISALPPHFLTLEEQGVDLGLAHFKLGLQPALAGIKHCNRLEQVLIKDELVDRGISDAIVCDLNNRVIETSVANIFMQFENDKTWYTPNLSSSGIDGVARQSIITKMQQASLDVEVTVIDNSRLENTSAMFICNALMNIVPVNKLTFISKKLDRQPVIALKQLFKQLGV